MATYRANYRLEYKFCPTCSQFKNIPTRNTYCSKECADRRNEVAEEPKQVVQPVVKQQLNVQDMVTRIVMEVMKNLPPQAFGAYEKPELDWTRSNFVDGWTVIISDVHIPYHHLPASMAVLGFLRDMASKGVLKRLILNGDIFDAASLSRHTKSRRAKYPTGDLGTEMKKGQPLVNAWAELFPEAYFIGGNHEDGRLQRHLANEGVGVPADPLAFNELLKFYEYDDRIRFIDRREVKIGFDDGQVTVFHGEVYNKHTAATILEKNRYDNAVQGHSHRPQIHFNKGQFGMVNGHLLDKENQDYQPDPDWTMGISILEHFNNGTQVNPYFIKITEDGEFSFMGKKYTADGVTL